MFNWVCSLKERFVFYLKDVRFKKCKVQVDTWMRHEVEGELGLYLGLSRSLAEKPLSSLSSVQTSFK